MQLVHLLHHTLHHRGAVREEVLVPDVPVVEQSFAHAAALEVGRAHRSVRTRVVVLHLVHRCNGNMINLFCQIFSSGIYFSI